MGRPRHPTNQALHAVLVLALLAMSGGIPVVQASVPYGGPGHEGAVPVGDDGAALALPLAPGENSTFVALTGLPDDVCRIVLDANGTYARTHLDWAPGRPEARVWADVGTTHAPYRVVSHWLSDLNGACTAEVTEDGTIWHDPRGRPYRDPVSNATRLFLAGHVGDTIRVAVTVTNEGTLPTKVSAALPLPQDGWKISGGSAVLDVQVEPLEAQEFWFDVDVPSGQKPVKNVAFIELTDDHGWAEKVTVLFDLRSARPAAPAPQTNETATDDALPEWTPPVRESAAPPLVVLAIALAAAARLARGQGRP